MTRESRSSKNRTIFTPSWVGGAWWKNLTKRKSEINNQQSKIGNLKSAMKLVPPQGFEPRTLAAIK
jgi:hypothetical protein